MSVMVAALARTNSKSISCKSESKMGALVKPAAVYPTTESNSSESECVVKKKLGESDFTLSWKISDTGLGPALLRQVSKASVGYDSDEEECESTPVVTEEFTVGPLVALKEQLERDKEDESLRRWKEKLLGSLSMDCIDERLEPEVQFLTVGMLSPGRPDITIPLPLPRNARGFTFSLKEGCLYSLKFTFTVLHNIVSGLKYVHTVWKGALQVDHHQIMLGTFSPQREPYLQIMEEETTPSGVLARGAYTAKTKFVDDDNKCYLEIDYSFEIRKDWVSSSRKWLL